MNLSTNTNYKYFYIFGKSNANISIILENLSSLYPKKDFIVHIIKNTDDSSSLPYKLDGVIILETYINDTIIDTSNSCILGVMKVPTKLKVYNEFNSKFPHINYINLIPTNCAISQTVSVGHGCLFNYGDVLAPYVKIGNFVTINRNCSIGHHTTIGNFVTINPGVNIAGNCIIGDNVTIGIGSNIIDGITVGSNSIIGAGSLVTKDIPDNVIVYGVPAKIIRINNTY